MIQNLYKFLIAFSIILLINSVFVNAQEAIPATGGNTLGNNGKTSYSIGQVFYTTISDIGGTVQQGVQQPVFSACPEDINNDGIITGSDLLLLLGKINTNCNGCPEDLTNDGQVSGADLLILIGSINTVCDD